MNTFGGDPNATPTPDTLDGWQAALECAFFMDRDPSEPFVFDIELSDEVRRWAGPQNASNRLAECVAKSIDLNSSNDVFRPLTPDWRRWRLGSRAAIPPNLGVLALTVAAASEMHRDKGATSQAYFYRLAQLLQQNESRDALLRLRERLSASFDLVAEWWCQFSEWVDDNPQVGINTIRKHPHLTRIGYPISQALIRRSDRMRITRFFDKLDMPSLGVPSESALMTQLELWAATPRDLSETFMHSLADPMRRSTLASYLHRLASAWDGVVLNPEGSTHLDIRLAVDLDEYSSRWVIRRKSEIQSLVVEINSQRVELSAPEYGAFFDWDGPMPLVRALPGEIAVVANGLGVSGKFVFPPLQPLRSDRDVGWLSEDDVIPYVPHILLVAPEWHSQVEQVLEACARRGWRRIGRTARTQLVSGRVVFIKVEIEDAISFKQAMEEIDPSLAQALRLPGGFRPRLINGLNIFRHLGQRHYLRGGEPDLLLPLGEHPRSVPAALDNARQVHPFHATGFPIPLRIVGPLEVGHHVLDVDGDELAFDVHAPADPPENHSLLFGWTRSGSTNEIASVEPPSIGKDAIVGAIVGGDMPEPLLLRRSNRQYYAIDRHGKITGIAPTPPNALFEHIGIPNSIHWEYTPQADVVWLIEERANGNLAAEGIHWREPHFRALDDPSSKMWMRIAQALEGSKALLDRYINAWKHQSAHAR